MSPAEQAREPWVLFRTADETSFSESHHNERLCLYFLKKLELSANSDDCRFPWGVYTKVLLNEESFLEQL